MKKLVFAAIIAAGVLGTLTSAPVRAQETVAEPILVANKHTAHWSKFQAVINKNAYWRSVVSKKGQDVAFNQWMRADHPYIYAAVCMKAATDLAGKMKNTEHMAEFEALQAKRADLRASVASVGHDVAFADWLRKEKPKVYKEHFQKEADMNAEITKPSKKR